MLPRVYRCYTDLPKDCGCCRTARSALRSRCEFGEGGRAQGRMTQGEGQARRECRQEGGWTESRR